MYTTGGADDNVNSILKDLHVIANDGSSDAGMTLNIHEIANSNNNLLDLLSKLTSRRQNQSLALLQRQIDLLKDRNRECGRLSSTRLGLGNNIAVCKTEVVSMWCCKQMGGSGGMVRQKRGKAYC